MRARNASIRLRAGRLIPHGAVRERATRGHALCPLKRLGPAWSSPLTERGTMAGSPNMKDLTLGPTGSHSEACSHSSRPQGAISSSTLIRGLGVSGKLVSLAHRTIDKQKLEQQETRDSLRV